MNFLIISPNSPYLSVGGVERYMKNMIEFCEKQPGHFYFVLPARSKNEIIKKKNTTIIFHESLSFSQKDRKGISKNATTKKQ